MLWIYNNEVSNLLYSYILKKKNNWLKLQGDSFPLTTMAEGDDVNKKCTVVNDALQKLWL